MATVGWIARPHGIRGQVIVNLQTDFPEERFQVGAELFVERGGTVTPLRIASVRFQSGRPVIAVEGVDTMNDAEALAGLELRVPVDRLMPLPEGAFYHHDLIGCAVETRGGRRVGVVKAVEGDAGSSRLVVEGQAGEILIPMAAEICVAVDIGSKRIVVDAPDGLLDLNSGST